MFQNIPKLFIILILCSSCVLISGCVPAAVVTGGAVLISAKDKPVDRSVRDLKIASEIKLAFAKRNFKGLYTKIKIGVDRGRVLLVGQIRDEQEALDAVDICWSVKGVKEVINELTLTYDAKHFDLQQYTKDSIITSQVKSRLFLSKQVKSVNYTIVTINSIVYLFGIARSEEELEAAAHAASTSKGVEKVVSHVQIIKEDEEW